MPDNASLTWCGYISIGFHSHTCQHENHKATFPVELEIDVYISRPSAASAVGAQHVQESSSLRKELVQLMTQEFGVCMVEFIFGSTHNRN
jgi:hypothetical protein